MPMLNTGRRAWGQAGLSGSKPMLVVELPSSTVDGCMCSTRYGLLSRGRSAAANFRAVRCGAVGVPMIPYGSTSPQNSATEPSSASSDSASARR